MKTIQKDKASAMLRGNSPLSEYEKVKPNNSLVFKKELERQISLFLSKCNFIIQYLHILAEHL